jgi:hypothetical protein
VTGSEHGDGRESRRPTPGDRDQDRHDPTDPLDEPVADRATLARRLRAVERALASAEGLEFETGGSDGADLDAMAERLETVEARVDALCRAVHAVGDCLVARDWVRDRARRTDDGTESVRRAVEALPGARDGHAPEPEGGVEGVDPPTVDGEDAPGDTGESPTEWLERVAAGGVTPPPVE